MSGTVRGTAKSAELSDREFEELWPGFERLLNHYLVSRFVEESSLQPRCSQTLGDGTGSLKDKAGVHERRTDPSKPNQFAPLFQMCAQSHQREVQQLSVQLQQKISV